MNPPNKPSQLGGIYKQMCGMHSVHLGKYGRFGNFLRFFMGLKTGVWWCQICDKDFTIGNGESRNRFTAYRNAIADIRNKKIYNRN